MKNSLQALTKKNQLLASLVLAAGLLTGCATVFTPVTAEDIVSQRAQQRVNVLLERKYDQAYEYLAPSYRALNNTESYRSRFGDGAKWIEPKVAKVECPTEDRCTVMVKLKILVVAPGFSKPIDSNIFETWLKEDGQWWYFQRD